MEGIDKGRSLPVKRGKCNGPPKKKPTRSSARLRNLDLPWETFSIDLIREKIFKFAMHQNNGNFHPQTACALRLVGKGWNESVVKILWKWNQPLFTVRLPLGKKLEGFMEIFRDPSSINRCIPPFSLFTGVRLCPCGEVEELEARDCFPILSNILSNCASGLLQLCIVFSVKNEYIPSMVIPSEFQWSLKKIKKLEMKIVVDHTTTVEDMSTYASLNLIKALFSRETKSLTYCHIQVEKNFQVASKYLFFQSVILPTTITTLCFGGTLESEDFEILANSTLPNLTVLRIMTKYGSISGDILSRCMEKFRHSLKKLSLESIHYRGPSRNPTRIRFPVMETLGQLFIRAINFELEDGLYHLDKLFPTLHTLRLCRQTSGMMRKWTTGSRLYSVTNFKLRLADESGSDPDLEFRQNVNMEIMQRVNFTFPNLRKLDICVTRTDPSGLQYVFMEMDKLAELKLIAFGNSNVSDNNSDHWDALLTGMPLETITRSKTDPDYWLTNQMIGDGAPSIKQLKELTTLHIEDDRSKVPTLFMSDFTLQFALYHMPKLKDVCLKGKLEGLVSDEMQQRWMREGRNLGVIAVMS